jgi:hypothetical protein
MSAGASNRFGSAAWASGGFDGVVLVVEEEALLDDDAEPPWLLPPQPASKTPIAATAVAAVNWRMVECPSVSPA